jgi:hypothetical protein
MRRATLAICLADAGFILFSWLSHGGSDIAGNAIDQDFTIFLTLVFAVTALPAFALALFGRLPRVALALALAFFLLLVLPDLPGPARFLPAGL